MKQHNESKQHPRLTGKGPQEIVDLFKSYNFADDHGHRLDMCQDFKNLICSYAGADVWGVLEILCHSSNM